MKGLVLGVFLLKNVTFLIKNRIIIINQNINTMEIKDYKTGDMVQVLINNPQNNNRDEWRDGEVLDVRMIYPNVGERHRPYPIVIVRTTRTYCKATPVYNFIKNIPIFVDNNLEFYDKENDEGFIYENQIRLRT